MSGRRSTNEPASTGSGLRWAAALVALAAAVFVLVRFTMWADYGRAGLNELRDALRDDGYAIIVLYVALVLIGAVLQTPVAVRRGTRLAAGWLTVAAFLGYGLAVAGLAALFAPHAPPWHADMGKDDPGSMYGVMLIFLLGGPTVVALAGGVFARRTDARTAETGRTHRATAGRRASARSRRIAAARSAASHADTAQDVPFTLADTLFCVSLMTGVLGVPTGILLSVKIALGTLPAESVIPDGGGTFVLLGAFGGGGVGAIAIVIGVVRLLGHRELPNVMRARGAGLRALTGVAGVLVVGSLLGAQLARVLPGVLVTVLGLLFLLTAGPAMGWFFHRRAVRA